MIVSSATARGTGEANEDAVLASSRVVLVIDGVSQWFTRESGCHHGTVWYVDRLARRILQHASGPGPLCDALADAIADVADLHRGSCDLTHPWTPAAAVAILRESMRWVEYLVLADCVLVAETRDEGIRVFTDDRLALLDREARQPNADAELRQQLAGGFQGLRNRPDGYWIAGSDPEAARHAMTGWLPRQDLLRAALMSDGLSCLVDGYGVMTWQEVLGTLHDEGPNNLIEMVRNWERADARCSRWPRTKKHDDASVAFCVFSHPDRKGWRPWSSGS
ncbi:integrase [Streptosporangium sp. NPDC000396]|uniref:integrase n=1 Tax=Streptosporangium sp. NPDC000396 TaxID=3366185 RepID=UPI003687C899